MVKFSAPNVGVQPPQKAVDWNNGLDEGATGVAIMTAKTRFAYPTDGGCR